MIKKMILVTIGVASLGLLIFGGVNRTLALRNQDTSESGNRHGYSEAGSLNSEIERQFLNQKDNGKTREEVNNNNDHGQNVNYDNSAKGGSGFGRPDETRENQLPLSFDGTLSEEEIAALQYMVEEEKLARDVYTRLYEMWGQNSFLNISQSEQTHMDSVKTLIDGYGLVDPSSSEAGKFTNPELQALYTDLVSQGSKSLVEAIKVGAAIEEIDILDLDESLLKTTSLDVQRVFENLRKGSINHLSAYARLYNRQTGDTYSPQFMEQDQYDSLLSSQNNGRNNGGGYRGGKNT